LDSEFVQTLIHVCTNWLLVIFDIFVNLIENILKQRARQAEELHRSDPVAQREASFVLSEEVLFLIIFLNKKKQFILVLGFHFDY